VETSPQPSDTQIFEYLKKTPPEAREGEGRGAGAQVSGSADQARSAAPLRLEQSYTVAYIAHAPSSRGPRWPSGRTASSRCGLAPSGLSACAASWPRPSTSRGEGARDRARHRRGYGGKHSGEAAIEAARLARAAGHPVKLVWTREEEFGVGLLPPAGVIDVKSGARADAR